MCYLQIQITILVINKQYKKQAVVTDVAIQGDSNIEKEHNKLEKYQGLKEEVERC